MRYTGYSTDGLFAARWDVLDWRVLLPSFIVVFRTTEHFNMFLILYPLNLPLYNAPLSVYSLSSSVDAFI